MNILLYLLSAVWLSVLSVLCSVFSAVYSLLNKTVKTMPVLGWYFTTWCMLSVRLQHRLIEMRSLSHWNITPTHLHREYYLISHISFSTLHQLKINTDLKNDYVGFSSSHQTRSDQIKVKYNRNLFKELVNNNKMIITLKQRRHYFVSLFTTSTINILYLPPIFFGFKNLWLGFQYVSYDNG